MTTFPQIIELAKQSGIPYRVVSTYRPGARTKSGGKSWHASGDAVDFGGYNQDKLAAYFLAMDTLETFHKSNQTGVWYGSSKGNATDEASHKELVDDHRNHLHVAMSPAQVANVKSSGLLGLLSGIPGLPGGIPTPWSAAASVTDVLRPIGIAGANIINPRFWFRIGMGVLGAGLIIVGILYLNRRAIGGAAKTIGGAVGNLAGTAVQGAAFGAGAGVTGLVTPRKPVSVAPVTTPAPVRKGPRPPAINPPPNAPTTSALPPEIYAPTSPGGTYSVTAVGRVKNPTEYRRPKGGTSLIDLAGKRNPTPPPKKQSRKRMPKPFITNPPPG